MRSDFVGGGYFQSAVCGCVWIDCIGDLCVTPYVGEVNKFLVENEVMVTGINACEENLEDYFSELIGGGGIA